MHTIQVTHGARARARAKMLNNSYKVGNHTKQDLLRLANYHVMSTDGLNVNNPGVVQRSSRLLLCLKMLLILETPTGY